MSELKPCPFCGGEAEFERLGDRRQSCIVVCTDCGGRHESGDEGAESGRSWNNRATPPIGTRYRNTDNEVVAVVVPAEATPDMCDQLTIAKHHLAVNKWRNALAALPSPTST